LLRAAVTIASVLTWAGSVASAQGASPSTPADGGGAWQSVQQALGGKGTRQPGDVLRFGFPRTDLEVTVDGIEIRPGLALGSWVAFRRATDGSAVVMGDLVLTESEVGPVMLALQHGGIEQTALHNHVLHESPRIMYMHIMGRGDAASLARTIRTALGASATPVTQATPAGAGSDAGSASAPTAPATPLDLDTAAITGDFVMTGAEVNRVIRALREHGIQVTALHSHMLEEQPRLFFMHFWANDDAMALARGLRAALDQTTVRRATR
jgi:hypothetical protein